MKKNFQFFVAWLCLLGIICMLGGFLKDTARYAIYSWSIQRIEQIGDEGYYVPVRDDNGIHTERLTWDAEISAFYKEAMADKIAFIESNKTAKFLHSCAYTSIGKIVRILTILVVFICFTSLMSFVIFAVKQYLLYIRWYIRRRIRRLKKRS